MGLHASKLNLESRRNANKKSLKSINKTNKNMSRYERKTSQVHLLSFKQNDASRKVSKVRFACPDEVKEDANMASESDIDEEEKRCSGRRTRVYRSKISLFSVTCYDEEDVETKKRSSSSSCTLSTVSSQVTVQSCEETNSEDEVFCEYSASSAHTVSNNDNNNNKNNNNKEKVRHETLKSTISISHLSVTCYEEESGVKRSSTSTTSTSSSTEYTSNQHQQRHTSENSTYIRARSTISVTCRQEVSENENNDNDTKEKEKGLESAAKESSYTRKVSQITLTCYTETIQEHNKNEGVVKMRDNSSKKRRKKTLLHMYDSTIEVCRSQKEIAKYCLPLPTSQFVGQTTSSIHTDEVDKGGNESLHLGVYLQLMDSYLRHFKTPEDFTGNEEFYLKLLQYISRKRQQPNESEEECYQRLLSDSKRFVEIYHDRGGFSQQLAEHKDYWGSRQQLLSSKVIADWVDKEHGPLDPVFGALLQPTTGRTGPGDSCWFHHFLFDGNGHMAYHSAVHDAFGYLKNYHDVGPGYDYMFHSMLSSSNPLAGQLDGMNFWKNVLKNCEFKPNISDLTNGALALLQFHPEKRNTVYF